ncbi:hypothetical protein O3P69_020693 [Scylla paramamosain]|uniref:Uncharacterized protein n=1 Tax=Scylla paramamosain TaxID=85552 RepID=A0AAW0TQF7_SCYPA
MMKFIMGRWASAAPLLVLLLAAGVPQGEAMNLRRSERSSSLTNKPGVDGSHSGGITYQQARRRWLPQWRVTHQQARRRWLPQWRVTHQQARRRWLPQWRVTYQQARR